MSYPCNPFPGPPSQPFLKSSYEVFADNVRHWLCEAMARRGISQWQLARKARVPSAVVEQILTPYSDYDIDLRQLLELFGAMGFELVLMISSRDKLTPARKKSARKKRKALRRKR